MQTIKVFILTLVMSSVAHANLEAGVGLSSGMSGRYVPGVALSYLEKDWALSGTSIGVQTSVYYISDYTLSYYRMWSVGKFLWGELEAGFGGGVGYSQRGYRSSTTSTFETKTEILAGPSFRATWKILSPFVFSFDGLYGFGIATIDLPPLMHDLVMFSLGCEL